MEKKTKSILNTNSNKTKYDQNFRKDFRRCMKALLLSESPDIVNEYLDKISSYAQQHEIYQMSSNSFLDSFPDMPDEAKLVIKDVFQQGVNCGIVLMLSLLVNNTGYFADCAFDPDEEPIKSIHQSYQAKKEKIKKL